MQNFIRSVNHFFRTHDRLAVWFLAGLAFLLFTGFLLTAFGLNALRQIEALGLLSFALGVLGFLYQFMGDRAKESEKKKQRAQNDLDGRFREVSDQIKDVCSKLDTRLDLVEAAIAVIRGQYDLLTEAITKLVESTTTNKTAIEWLGKTDAMRRDLQEIRQQLAGVAIASDLQLSVEELQKSIEELREKIQCEQP